MIKLNIDNYRKQTMSHASNLKTFMGDLLSMNDDIKAYNNYFKPRVIIKLSEKEIKNLRLTDDDLKDSKRLVKIKY